MTYEQTYYLNDGKVYNGDEYELSAMTGLTISVTAEYIVDTQQEECHGPHTIYFEERNYIDGQMVWVSYEGDVLQTIPLTPDQLKMIGEFMLNN